MNTNNPQVGQIVTQEDMSQLQLAQANTSLTSSNIQLKKYNLKYLDYLKILPVTSSYAFGALELNPKNSSFENQQQDEMIYLIVRQHWITNVGWFIRNTIYILIPAIAVFLVIKFNLDITFFSLKVIFLIILTYYSLIFTNILRLVANWYFDPFIVTNERIMDYDYRAFRREKVSEMSILSIEDVKQVTSGLLGDIFDYGILELGGENIKSVMLFQKIPKVSKVRDIITQLSNISKKYTYGDV